VREGLICVLSIKLPNPRFESQTKVKLVNTEIDGIVNSVVYDGLMTFFDKNPPIAKRVFDKVLTAARARGSPLEKPGKRFERRSHRWWFAWETRGLL